MEPNEIPMEPMNQAIENASEQPAPNVDFAQMDLSKEIMQAVRKMGFSAPTPVQAQTIPVMMAGHDVIAIAPTGTGKTCAFGIPMLEYISLTDERIQEVVLAPTRELAVQIGEELQKLAAFIPEVRIAVLYGGQPIAKQMNQLKRRPQIVVATPGRMLDHMHRGTARLGAVHTLVIDEADEMLKMGFVQDVCKIIEAIPSGRQFVMFSATTNQDVLTISWKYQHDPVEITIAATNENKPKITQYVIPTTREEKYDHLLYLLDSDEYGRIMIFVNTKDMTHRLCERLRKAGYQAEELHGDIPQSKRNQVMTGFKHGKFPILVCTDVAARGIDVDDVEAVINYDLPNENEYYVHRIGRTGRARKHGVAFTLLSFTESVRLDEILKYLESQPTYLKFDDMGVLRTNEGQAFFDEI
ncbi:MAG: DEAD/DEAH box helicase [Eubacteriales bacterium]|nr:DEAD/DEAH box helicase [Eubacteriales bacterium]